MSQGMQQYISVVKATVKHIELATPLCVQVYLSGTPYPPNRRSRLTVQRRSSILTDAASSIGCNQYLVLPAITGTRNCAHITNFRAGAVQRAHENSMTDNGCQSILLVLSIASVQMRVYEAVEEYVDCIKVWLRSRRVVQGKIKDEGLVDAGLVGKGRRRQQWAAALPSSVNAPRRSNTETMLRRVRKRRDSLLFASLLCGVKTS